MDSASLLRLVSERTRHALLSALRQGERTVTQLVAQLQDEQTNVSHHLATLRQANLVSVRKQGRQQIYRLSDPEVGRLLDQVESLAARLDQVAYVSALGLPVEPAYQGYG
jgi:DNA-binding transcriptional ArsR family regulator